MSPAKRLSRQRFRALCERCAVYLGARPVPRLVMRRMHRFATSRSRCVSMFALARLAQ